MLIGNLGRDPELKYSQQGTAIAQFSVATRTMEGQERRVAGTHGVVCRGELRPQGRNRRRESAQGSRVYLEGRKRTESWDDKQTGAKHYRDLVYVDKIEFLDSRASGNGQQKPASGDDDETTLTDGEVPF